MIMQICIFLRGESFNRYIVECKELGKDILLADRRSFNRYIVECKYDSRNT